MLPRETLFFDLGKETEICPWVTEYDDANAHSDKKVNGHFFDLVSV